MANNFDTANAQDPTAISSDDDGVVVPFPDAVEAAAVERQAPTDEEIILGQDALLDCWVSFAGDLKRRVGRELPGDLRFDLGELVRESRL